MASRKILAIKLRAMGDTVLMTAPLAELRRAYPEAEIHALVAKPWAPVMQGHPAVDRLWTFESPSGGVARTQALAGLGFQLRKERFDCVVNFHASTSSSLLALATGARTRSIHFHGHKHRNRHSTVTVPGKGVLKPAIERDMDAVRALGLHVPAGRLPQIELAPGELADARERLVRLGLDGPVLGLGLGASRPTKSWDIERFAALAVEWCKTKPGGGVLAVAGPDENSQVHDFLHAIDDLLSATVSDLTERAAVRARISAHSNLPLRQTAAVLGALSVFAGNDSGPRHLAVAAGTPTVTLFGPEHPYEWHPYPEAQHPFFFIDGLACRRDADPGMPPWCGLSECVVERHKCMHQIGVDAVLSACLKVARVLDKRGHAAETSLP